MADIFREKGDAPDAREVLASSLDIVAAQLPNHLDATHISLDLGWPEGHTLEFAETCRRAAQAIRKMP